MAHVAQQTSHNPSLLRSLSASLEAVFNAFLRIGQVGSRAKQVEALNALSDEELAKRGVSRQEIVRHVFADVYYM